MCTAVQDVWRRLNVLMQAIMHSFWSVTCSMAFNRDCLSICLQMQLECLHMQVIATRINTESAICQQHNSNHMSVCHVMLSGAEIRDHAQSRIKAALQDNNHVQKSSINRAAMDVEQRCYNRATESDNAR